MNNRFIAQIDPRDNPHSHGCFDLDNGQYIASGNVGAMNHLVAVLNSPDIDVVAWQPFEYGPQTLLIPVGRRMSPGMQNKLEATVASIFDVISLESKDDNAD